jgi:RNA polymerase sigma-70 factor (ECF subfamily)
MRVKEEEIRFIVKMAKRGNRRGMEKIYEIFAEPIFRYIFLRIGSREEAEDLTSRVFLKVFRRIKMYRESEVPFSAWIFRIAHNELVDYFRTKKPPFQSLDEVYDEPASSYYEPEIKLLEEELQKRIVQALMQLTPEQREAVVLRYLEGFSIKEIGEVMGKGESAVRSLLSRALRRLNRIFLKKGDVVVEGATSPKVIAFKERG